MSTSEMLSSESEKMRLALGIDAESIHADTEPFWIDRRTECHVVLAGSVDVFAVACEYGEAVGARHHLFRLGEGGILLATERMVRRFGIVAVPAPGARYATLAPSDWSGDRQSAYVEGLTRFVLAAGEGIIDDLPPRLYRALAGGDAGTYPAGTVLSGVGRLLWLTLDSGQLALFGREDARVGDGARFPLGARSWAIAGEAEVSVRALPFEVTGDGDLADLSKWVDDLYEVAANDILDGVRREAERLTRKAEKADAVMHQALERFLIDGEADVAGSAPAGLDEAALRLFDALKTIGKPAGIEFIAPNRLNKTQTIDRAEEFVAASKVRSRRVMLREGWWESDNGPLLGFLAADGDSSTVRKPVALLPVNGRQYRLYDPETREWRIVTAETAGTVEAFALSFYRVFPPRPLSLLDLARFGTFGAYRDLAFVLLAGALAGLLGMATPMVSGRLIDSVIPSANKIDVVALTAVLLATAVASAFFSLSRSICVLRLEGKMDSALQAAVWDRVLALPTEFFRRFAAGDLALRINGVNTIRKALSGAVMSSLLTGVFSLFNVGLLFYYNGKLAFAALGLIVVGVAISLTTGYLKLRCERQLATLAGKISGMVYQYLNGIVKLRVCAAEGRAFANWSATYTRLRGLTIRTTQLSNIEGSFFAGYGVIVNAVLFAVIGLVLFREQQATMTTGEFIAFNSAFGTVFSAVMELSRIGLSLLNLVPVYERTQPILQTAPEVDTSKIVPGELKGEIEIQKLSFGYGDGPPVLHDFSCHIRPGEFVAVVGPSGSGKSTLLRLLMGFERPSVGSVCYDNHNLVDLDVQAMRKQLGVVLQSGQLMAGDIFNNIAGATAATLDEVWEAARLCGLEEDINNMPMGLHTVIGEGSSTLSGGQRQRILIARAIVGKPRILFFDEATSALDNRTQTVVSESLERLKATRIVIAHRLSTVVKADRILVMQDGRLVQSGRYEELLAQPGLFAELAKRQIA